MAIKLVTNGLTEAKIRVVGIGGGGGNALNSMVDKGIEGVEFVAINTDMQALNTSKADVKIQIGRGITKGLGTGMIAETGFKSVEESREEIERALEGSDMIFITAGMGGGTGTGGAPAVARIAKNINSLVVGIITKPFNFEGKPRSELAIHGIEKLKAEVDSLIVIPNQKISHLISEDATEEEAFAIADKVLYNATKGISQIITRTGRINVDFADVRTIMKDMGDAMIGSGIASGENRCDRAVNDALSNPVLEQIDIMGSKCILTNICHNGSLKYREIEKINETIQKAAGEDAKYIFGLVTDEDMKDELMVTLIATGFNTANAKAYEIDTETISPDAELNKKYIGDLDAKITTMPTAEELAKYDIPAAARRKVQLNDDLSEDKIEKKKLFFDENEFEEFDLEKNDFNKPAFLRRQMD
jgi:cell division protein FtsZ